MATNTTQQKKLGYSVTQRMNTAEWETWRKLETGRGRNVNTAVGRQATCKIKRKDEEEIIHVEETS
jgi:hypothetical protein